MIRRIFMAVILAMLYLASTLPAATNPPADPKLRVAYRRLYFDRLYPPEIVKEMQEKLQNAPRALPVLAEMAKDQRREVRVLVAMLLGDLGEADGAQSLWNLMRDDAESVRMAASGAIVHLRQIAPIIIDGSILKDKRSDVRRMAVSTIGRLSGPTAEPLLLRGLEDEDEMVRTDAVRSLHGIHTEQVTAALIERLKDRSPDVRTVAAGAMAGRLNATTIKALKGTLKDPDWHVRATTIMVLGKQSRAEVPDEELNQAIVGVLESDDFALVRDRAADVLIFTGSEKVAAALVKSILSNDKDVRFHAARAICNGKIVAALPLLMKHVKHTNPEVRERIMEIFGTIGGEAQMVAIQEAINDPVPPVQLAALNALRKIGKSGGIDRLLKKLDDPNPHVRADAARTLGEFNDKTIVKKLIPLLRDEFGYVRSAAAEALGKLGDRSAVPILLALLKGEKTGGVDDDGGLLINPKDSATRTLEYTELQKKIRAAAALGEVRSPEAVDPLISEGLKAADPDLRAAAAYSLGQIRDQRAVVPLKESVRPYYETMAVTVDVGPVFNPGNAVVPDTIRKNREKEARVRASVAWALGQLNDPRARETLLRAVNDENSLVRDAAHEALAKLTENEDRERRKAQELADKSAEKSEPKPQPKKKSDKTAAP